MGKREEEKENVYFLITFYKKNDKTYFDIFL